MDGEELAVLLDLLPPLLLLLLEVGQHRSGDHLRHRSGLEVFLVFLFLLLPHFFHIFFELLLSQAFTSHLFTSSHLEWLGNREFLFKAYERLVTALVQLYSLTLFPFLFFFIFSVFVIVFIVFYNTTITVVALLDVSLIELMLLVHINILVCFVRNIIENDKWPSHDRKEVHDLLSIQILYLMQQDFL